MKLNLSLAKLASITGGTLRAGDPDKKVHSFVTDSRVIDQGDCFIALKGNSHDAHHFLEEVIQKGASLVVCEKGRCSQEERQCQIPQQTGKAILERA